MALKDKASVQLFKSEGFSLVELLVVLAIIVIITIIAIPSYFHYTMRAHRADGIHSLMSIALEEEEYRLHQGVYTGTLNDIWHGAASEAGYYTIALQMLDTNGSTTNSGEAATGFQITATATGVQAGDSDCATLTLSVNNGSISKTPAKCWRGS